MIVGVNEFVDEGAAPVPTLYIDETVGEKQTAALAELRRRRSQAEVSKALDQVRRTAEGTGNLMEPLVEAVRAYATVGEMCDALREVWGEWVERPVV